MEDEWTVWVFLNELAEMQMDVSRIAMFVVSSGRLTVRKVKANLM
jgi:hypothetical protein